MLEQGITMRTREIQTWLDAGTIDALLETNQYLLSKRADNSAAIAAKPGVSLVPPVYIHPSARIEACAIGPYVSVGRDCTLIQSVIKNSILEDGTQITRMILEDSVVGSNVRLVGQATRLNLGDNSWAQS
jgi:glucose-1-phosphate thymidylyltransferase